MLFMKFKTIISKQQDIFLTITGLFFILLFSVPFSFGYYYLPLFLLAVVINYLVIFKKPDIGIYIIVIATFIVERFFTWAPIFFAGREIKIYLLDFLILATVLGIIRNRRNYNFKILTQNKLSQSVAIFLLIAIFGFLRSLIDLDLDIGLGLATLKNFFYAIFYFLAVLIFNQKDKILYLVRLILICGLFLTFFVFFGYATGHGLWSDITPGVRLVAAPHAAYLVTVFFLGFAFWLKQEYIFQDLKRKNILMKFLPFILLVQIAGFMGGMFRHLWMGFLVGLIIFLILLKKLVRKKLFKFVLFLFLIIILVLALWYWFNALVGSEARLTDNYYLNSFFSRSQTLFELDDDKIESSFGWRLAVSGQGWQEFLKSPWLGIGLGGKIRFTFRNWEQIIEVRTMHNDLVGIIMQFGILGIVSFFMIIFINFQMLVRIYKNHDQKLSAIGLWLIGFFAVQLVAIIFSLYFSSNMISLFFWLFLGLTTALFKLIKTGNN